MPQGAIRMTQIRIVVHGIPYPIPVHKERNGTISRPKNSSQALGKDGIAHVKTQRDPIAAIIVFGWLIGYNFVPIHADYESFLGKASQ